MRLTSTRWGKEGMRDVRLLWRWMVSPFTASPFISLLVIAYEQHVLPHRRDRGLNQAVITFRVSDQRQQLGIIKRESAKGATYNASSRFRVKSCHHHRQDTSSWQTRQKRQVTLFVFPLNSNVCKTNLNEGLLIHWSRMTGWRRDM